MEQSTKDIERQKKLSIIRSIRQKGIYEEACESLNVKSLSKVSISDLNKFLKSSYKEGFRSSSRSFYDDAYDY